MAIEYVLGKLKDETVIGVVEARGSISIVVHNLKNPLIKAMKECQERIKPEVMSAVINISCDIALAGREKEKE